MELKNLKKLNIPDKPGVYRFMRGREILYIGKATSLKDRVRSYFPSTTLGTGRLMDSRGPLIVDMVFKAKGVKWETTDSVLEAMILEANLIKKHQPYYNTKEKSDKSFNYVCITREEVPKILVRRGKGLNPKSFAKVYGPYPSGGQLKEALRIVRRIFPFYDDKSKNYKEFYKQIALVPERKEEVLRNIKHIKLFFEGKKKRVLQSLKKEMMARARERRFEEASEIKRQIFALTHINDVALIKNDGSAFSPLLGEEGVGGGDGKKNHLALKGTPPKTGGEGSSFRIEAYDIAHMSGRNMVGVMTVVEYGEPAKGEYKKFKIKTQENSNDTGALTEILERRFAHAEWQYPRLIVVDGSTAQINTAKKVLKNLGIEIPIVSVVKDDRHKPLAIRGDAKYAKQYEQEILLANSEAHRFAIGYHKQMRNKNFLK